MIIHKDMIDLIGYGVVYGDGLSIIPEQIDAYNDKCKIVFKVMNEQYEERTIVYEGGHDNFVVSTSIEGIPFTVDLQSGMLKRVRDKFGNTSANVKQINPSVRIVDGDFLEITKTFAENNLSKVCLKLADWVDEEYYVWEMRTSAFMVCFEIPAVFDVGVQDILSDLIFHCGAYIKETGITSNNFMDLYKENKKKVIID